MTEPDLLPSRLQEVSTQLTRARARATALPGPPSHLPATLDEAYALQDRSIKAWNDEVAGWKVGGMPGNFADEFGVHHLAGPIFKRQVHYAQEDCSTAMPVFDGGFAAIEPEFIFQLGSSREDDRLFIGAEIASSPIPAINDYGPMAIISDFGNNNGLLVGPEIQDWRNRGGEFTVATYIDGQLIAEKKLSDFPAAAMSALDFLLKLSERRGYELPAGTFVSSGAITGVHEASVGAASRLEFGDAGTIELQLVGAVPA